MAKTEAKLLQKELETGRVRPVYWLYGPERMKIREMLKKIEAQVLQGEPRNDFNYERLDAAETRVDHALDAAQSLSLMGGTKLVVVFSCEEWRELEPLGLFLKQQNHEAQKTEDLSSVLVLISKNFDARKKTSKVILEQACVVEFEAVSEQDREPWIDYLSKRRGLTLNPEEKLALISLDPWNLERADLELAKLELLKDEPELRLESLLQGLDAFAKDQFIEGWMRKERGLVLKVLDHFGSDLEFSLPILGLLAWNVRQLLQFKLERAEQSHSKAKRHPSFERKCESWSKKWSIHDLLEFQAELSSLDQNFKSSKATVLGAWMEVLLQFTKSAGGTSR